jgi:hypothetical protein
MLYRSTSEVMIPAHKLGQFKAALIRHAPIEHRVVSAELGPISVFQVGRNGAHATVRVLIDSELARADLGEFADQWETEDSRSAAEESIGFAIARVGGEWGYLVDTERVE